VLATNPFQWRSVRYARAGSGRENGGEQQRPAERQLHRRFGHGCCRHHS